MLCCQVFTLAQQGHGFEYSCLLQPAVTATIEQLKNLGNEFNFSDAAEAEFDVVRAGFTLNLLVDILFEFTQALKHPIVKVAAVDKRR